MSRCDKFTSPRGSFSPLRPAGAEIRKRKAFSLRLSASEVRMDLSYSVDGPGMLFDKLKGGIDGLLQAANLHQASASREALAGGGFGQHVGGGNPGAGK